DREAAGHVEGLVLHHDELPALFAHLLAGEEIEVADVARDRRTAELHRVLNAFGTKALLSVPVSRNDQVIGAAPLHAEIYRGMAVMVLRFTDAAAMAVRLSGAPRCISDEIACGLQQIA